MKKLILIIVVLITGYLYPVKSEIKNINHQGIEIGFFYSSLSPYGSWIELDAGMVVWRPTIMRTGWAPYREGRWIWTVDGWYWDSYEPFGHIVFHYGRWYYDDFYGWIWIPDYDWAPSWVEWRYDNDYIGWAPLPPYAVFSINIGVHYTNNYYVPYHHWHFVKYGHFYDPYVYNYYVAPKYKYRVYNKTKYRNNYGYRDGRIINRGVDIEYVRKHTGQDIRQRDIERVSDYREVEKYRGKDTETIRTFVASRDELTKSRVNDNVKIEKQNKRSSLDISKVRLGKEADVKERNVEVRSNVEKSAGRDINERQITVEKRDNQIEKNNSEIQKRNNPDVIKRNDSEIQKRSNTEIKRNETIRTEKKSSIEIIPEKKVQRNEVNTRQKNEVDKRTEIKRENTNGGFDQQRKENRTEVRKEVNRNESKEVKRNDSVKRNNSGNTKTRTR